MAYEFDDDLDEIWSILKDYETENYWPEEHFDMIKKIFEKISVRL